MGKTVLKFGLLTGVIMACLQGIILAFCHRGYITFDNTSVVGFAGMLVVFSVIFFGIRSYRDDQGNGSITFWKAMQIGLLITLVASVIHAVGWQVYNILDPDFKEFFIQKYTDYQLSNMSDPNSPEASKAIKQQMEMMRGIYANPILDIAVSVMSVLPSGIFVTLVSAFILRRKSPTKENIQ